MHWVSLWLRVLLITDLMNADGESWVTSPLEKLLLMLMAATKFIHILFCFKKSFWFQWKYYYFKSVNCFHFITDIDICLTLKHLGEPFYFQNISYFFNMYFLLIKILLTLRYLCGQRLWPNRLLPMLKFYLLHIAHCNMVCFACKVTLGSLKGSIFKY